MPSSRAKPDFERETPSELMVDRASLGDSSVVLPGTSPHARQKEMESTIAEEVVSYCSAPDAPDLTLTPRASALIATVLLVGTWTTIVDLQLELEDRNVLIPMASLYPLLERLVAIGFIERKSEQGSKGRPKAFYRITHTGRCAVTLVQAVAKSQKEPG
jgi:hypothetical protein